MTIQEKRDYLSRYLQAERGIEAKLEMMERLQSMAERITTVLSETPHSASDSTSRIELAVEKLDCFNREINGEIDRYIALGERVTTLIGQLHDMTMRTILEYRYLNGATWEQIGQKLGFTYQWVCALHKRALVLLDFSGAEAEEENLD